MIYYITTSKIYDIYESTFYDVLRGLVEEARLGLDPPALALGRLQRN